MVSETEMLFRYLRDLREAVFWKPEGLSEYDMRRPLTPTGTNLRHLSVHIITETARHLGHINILREQIDGKVGLLQRADNLPDAGQPRAPSPPVCALGQPATGSRPRPIPAPRPIRRRTKLVIRPGH